MLPASGSTCADGRWSNGSGQTAAVKRKQSNVVVGGNLHVDERGELWREQRLHLAPRGSERRQVRGADTPRPSPRTNRTRRVPLGTHGISGGVGDALFPGGKEGHEIIKLYIHK